MTQDDFIQALSQHKRILYKLAYSYCRTTEDRHDLVQEMTMQLWRSYPQFDHRVLFSTWMYRVAMNVAISHVRQQSHPLRVTISLDTIPFDEFGLDLSEVDQYMSTQSDNMRVLDLLIRELDELSRALILLFLDGFDYEEIAGILGISASNVSTRLNRLKQKLQTQFAEKN
jgi:RNA polymerase sigma factor (sigma-70 family)